ncbi:hypothetical protein [Clostridium aciditolerans]|uniref:Uncharacterized protein n=1 Tax=Clostridium aciditolerans TaxID=339861 RepID=A0A934M5C4_9CLOT|nr:hypothetical protein [Clostridium aciditolerans]MBI6871876.1 hypothetical protein [Clostridium aciditolerans]
MIKRMKNKLFATLCVAALTLGAVVPSTFNSVHAAGTPKTVYVDVEKNVLGQAPILQPVAVTLDDSSTILDATKQAAGAANVSSVSSGYGNYVNGFADTSDTQAVFNKNYKYYKNVKDATKGIVFTSTAAQPIITDANWLREKECSGISGWMFTVQNTDNNAGNYYSADTKLADLPSDAVIRWEFSAAMGADIGLNAYLPTQTKADGYYDWNTAAYTSPFFTRANKTTLIKAMAKHSNKTDAAYTNALNDLKNLTISQADVDDDMDVSGNLK